MRHMLDFAGVPREIITRVHDVLAKQMSAREMRDLFIGQGHEVGGLGPGDYANFIRAEIGKWARVAKAAGIRKQ